MFSAKPDRIRSRNADVFEMKKIYLTGYKSHNLGDDLFFLQIIRTYPRVKFFFEDTSDGYYQRLFSEYQNVQILKPVIPSLWRKIMNKVLTCVGIETKSSRFPRLSQKEKLVVDAVVVIGGSIFIEPKKCKSGSERYVQALKEYFFHAPILCMGANFGPYQTDEYLISSKKRVKAYHSICFRDQYSYNMFSDIPSVRYAPDILYGYRPEEATKTIPRSIGISLIDLSYREGLISYKELYLSSISNYLNHNQFIRIFLFDFCDLERDGKAIEELLPLLSQDCQAIVEVIRYNCNPHEFMKVFGCVETVIATRFHAMILALVFQKITIPISYSNKIDNAISDMPNPIGYIKINAVSENRLMELAENYVVPEISSLVTSSKLQFGAFDEIIGIK